MFWMSCVFRTLHLTCRTTAVVTPHYLKLFMPCCLQPLEWSQTQCHTYITCPLEEPQLVCVEANSAKNPLMGAQMCSKGSVHPSEEAPADAIRHQPAEFREETWPCHSQVEEGGGQGGCDPWECGYCVCNMWCHSPCMVARPPSSPEGMGPKKARSGLMVVKQGVQRDSTQLITLLVHRLASYQAEWWTPVGQELILTGNAAMLPLALALWVEAAWLCVDPALPICHTHSWPCSSSSFRCHYPPFYIYGVHAILTNREGDPAPQISRSCS